MIKQISIFLIFICAQIIFAQNQTPIYSSQNKKAIKAFDAAINFYGNNNKLKALEAVADALDKDPNFIEPYTLRAQINAEKSDFKTAIDDYNKTISINPNFNNLVYYSIGTCYYYIGDYTNAEKHLQHYITHQPRQIELEDKSKKYILDCAFAAEAVKHPVPFAPKNLGVNINSPFYEYFPSITADGKTLIFTRNGRTGNGDGNAFDTEEDFYQAKKITPTLREPQGTGISKNDEWTMAAPVKGLNSKSNEGAPSIAANGQFIFFAACADINGKYLENQKGFGSCDIFYAQKVGNNWGKPVNVGPPICTGNWESQPSFSSDGKTLYFVRGKLIDGMPKQQDIYVSEIGEDGRFTTPVRLNDNINTPDREEAVYIHPDNQTLYFTSDGRPGMGDLDIYFSRKQTDGTWGKAINIGYPINTFNTESGLLVAPDGKTAYFTSDRKEGFGGLDIYEFDLPEAAKPMPITYAKGLVFNAKTKAPLDAYFELIDLNTGKTMITSYADQSTGEFLLTLNTSNNYALNVSKKGYIFYSDNFSLKDKTTSFDKPFELKVPLMPIDTGNSVVLKNVFFENNKFDLKPESKIELNKVAAFLKTNPTVKIELGGHTDNIGDKKTNKLLSENRAKAVLSYLVTESKIEATRLSFKGYADAKPLAKNDTEDNKALNRRTEFKIVGK
jgi:outer membrane protein OmpA-like peptidoglycan-associated protein/tetratricopeptide (TPR) repeat protein